MRHALAPLAAAALGLAGCLAITLFLHRAATTAVERAIDERLRGTGQAAALLLSPTDVTQARLRGLMDANGLDGALVVDGGLKVVADATGPSGMRVDMLRVDPSRVEQALGGEVEVAAGYRLGELTVATGYFPIRGEDGRVAAVLALEAGEAFTGAGKGLPRALALGVVLSVLSALSLALAAARYRVVEQREREAAARAARGEALARMAAVAAHEIRNPLGVIRGTVELMRDRISPVVKPRDLEALDDVLSEVERLKRLTQDFLDLSSERPLERGEVDLETLLAEAGRATEAAFPAIQVKREAPGPLPAIPGDAGRLRQVLANLLTNAAQAQREGAVELDARVDGGAVRIRVRDHGPGVPPELRDKLFEPFVTGRVGGTGLGLAVSRQIVQRHGGSLTLLSDPEGATFEIRLPLGEGDARLG